MYDWEKGLTLLPQLLLDSQVKSSLVAWKTQLNSQALHLCPTLRAITQRSYTLRYSPNAILLQMSTPDSASPDRKKIVVIDSDSRSSRAIPTQSPPVTMLGHDDSQGPEDRRRCDRLRRSWCLETPSFLGSMVALGDPGPR